jgi:hypothetical protein
MNETAKSSNAIFIILAKKCSWVLTFSYIKLKVINLCIVLILLCIAVGLNSSMICHDMDILKIAISECSLHSINVLSLSTTKDLVFSFKIRIFISFWLSFFVFYVNIFDVSLWMEHNLQLFYFTTKRLMIPLKCVSLYFRALFLSPWIIYS